MKGLLSVPTPELPGPIRVPSLETLLPVLIRCSTLPPMVFKLSVGILGASNGTDFPGRNFRPIGLTNMQSRKHTSVVRENPKVRATIKRQRSTAPQGVDGSSAVLMASHTIQLCPELMKALRKGALSRRHVKIPPTDPVDLDGLSKRAFQFPKEVLRGSGPAVNATDQKRNTGTVQITKQQLPGVKNDFLSW